MMDSDKDKPVHPEPIRRSGDTALEPGRPRPLGVTLTGNGANFALYSRHATAVRLLVFPSAEASEPSHTFDLDPVRNRTDDVWHIWVAGVTPGQCYVYRVDGPYQPDLGLRFNSHRVLMDPYATAFTGVASWDFELARGYDPASPLKDLAPATTDNLQGAARAVVVENRFDWAGSRSPRHTWERTIIYETHVRGLTVHPSSGVRFPGTYKGLIEKIPYFKELGVTALELMPVQEFNENETKHINPENGEVLRNYWGYNPVGFFAPKEGYASSKAPGAQIREFKEMVRALHEADIEVIIDVVFNHSAERDEVGPTLSFRGLDNSTYYLLANDKRHYKDFSGCLNTLNCNHPVIIDLVLECLRYWVQEMGVDGFRFDLASIMARDASGAILNNPPLLESIAQDPVLRGIKLIAEPWDAGGAFQAGRFYGSLWSEWNSYYRDDVRRFWRGDAGMKGALATRICGSADIFERGGKLPANSINFVTCHDGFTLSDVVSYSGKRNLANAQHNTDGTDENFSFNHGAEGESGNPAVGKLRLRQIKNMLGTLLLSRGTPMLLGGDEFRRTQSGNNNAYCQDNEISWYDWSLLERNRELVRFTREMIALRLSHPVLSENRFYTDEEVIWFGRDGSQPDWGSADRTLGCLIRDIATDREALCLIFNAEDRDVEFVLPERVRSRDWRLRVDTAATSPGDIYEPDRPSPPAKTRRVQVSSKSLVVLVC